VQSHTTTLRSPEVTSNAATDRDAELAANSFFPFGENARPTGEAIGESGPARTRPIDAPVTSWKSVSPAAVSRMAASYFPAALPGAKAAQAPAAESINLRLSPAVPIN